MPGKVLQIEDQNIVVSLGIRGVKIKEIVFVFFFYEDIHSGKLL